jgi:DNA primase
MSTDGDLQQFVEAVRDKTPLEAVLRDAGVTLRHEGARLRGLCPLHADQRPSLVVFPAQDGRPERFHCFGACAQGGDVFTLLQLLGRHASRWAAITERAKTLGLELPKREGTAARQPHPAEAALAIAQRAYAEQLTPEVLAYLAKRGFPEAFVRAQGIGYAPPGQRSLAKDALTKAGANLALARGASLIGGKDDSDYFGQYGGWIIFPNRRRPDRIIDLQGRAFPEAKDKPKWLTRRGRVMALWNMDALGRPGEIVIAEGITDGLSLVLAGVPAIAVFGQSGFKPDWAPWFARVKTVYVAYYRDATARAVQVAKLFGDKGRVVLLPDGLGPKGDLNDLLVKAGSVDRFRGAMRKLLDAAKLPLEVEIARLAPGPIVGLRERLDPLLREIGQQELFVKDHLLRLLADRTGLTLETLRLAVRESAPRRGNAPAKPVATSEAVR